MTINPKVRYMVTEDHIKQVALAIIAKIAPEADIENLDFADRLRNQIDFDSVDFMNFAVGLQEQLNVAIPEKDYPQLATLTGCMAYLKSKCNP
ncbi:MAG: acyl carrier protein [Desulfatirhabdiaceae bacterium]